MQVQNLLESIELARQHPRFEAFLEPLDGSPPWVYNATVPLPLALETIHVSARLLTNASNLAHLQLPAQLPAVSCICGSDLQH